MDIFAGKIGGGQIVADLLLVSGMSYVDLLGDTGSQNGSLCGEDIVVDVFTEFHIVAGQLAQVVCESIAAGAAQIGQLGRGCTVVTGVLQSGDHLVCRVLGIDFLPQAGTAADAVQTVLDYEIRTVFIAQVCGEVTIQDIVELSGDILLTGQHLHDIEAVQIAHKIGGAEAPFHGLYRERFPQEIILADLFHHFFQRAGDPILIHQAQQVAQVTAPTGNVSVVFAVDVGIGNVHGAEHVANIGLLAAGEREGLDILHAGNLDHFVGGVNGQVVGFLVVLHILDEVLVLVARHDLPGTGVVTIHAGTDVLDENTQGILAGILSGVVVCDLFQKLQILHEGIEVGDIGLGQSRSLDFASCLQTVGTLLMGIIAGSGIGGQLGGDILPIVAIGRLRSRGGAVADLAG